MKIKKIILTGLCFLLITGCKAKEKKVSETVSESQNIAEEVTQDLPDAQEVQEEEPQENQEQKWLWERDEKYFNPELADKSLKIMTELSKIVKESVSEEMNAIDNEYPEDRPTEHVTRENSYFTSSVFPPEEYEVWELDDNKYNVEFFESEDGVRPDCVVFDSSFENTLLGFPSFVPANLNENLKVYISEKFGGKLFIQFFSATSAYLYIFDDNEVKPVFDFSLEDYMLGENDFSNATGHHIIFSDEEIIIVWFSYDNVTGRLKRYYGYKINKDFETVTPFCEEA